MTATDPSPACSVTGAAPSAAGPFGGVRLEVVEDDRTLWRLDLGSQFLRHHVLDDGVLFGSLRGGPIFAIDAATCRELWNAPQIFPAIRLATDDDALFTVEEVSVAAIGRDDGRQRWRHLLEVPDGSAIQAPDIVVGDGVVVVPVGGSAARLDGFDAGDGAPRFSIDLGADLTVTGVAVGDGSVAATAGDRVLLVDATSGDLLWTAEPGFAPTGAPATAEGLVVAADGTRVAAIEDGRVAWMVDHGAPGLLGPPTLAGRDRVLVLGADGLLRTVGPTGVEPTPVAFPACCTSPRLDDGFVVVDRGGTTTGFDLEGRELWSVRTGADAAGRFARVAVEGDRIAVLAWSTPDAR